MFSGTGNLALEALSRGACHAVMVDTAQESIAAIKFNAQHTKLLDKAEILKADIFAAVKKFHQKKLKFDIIFCDPPYHKNLCLQSKRKKSFCQLFPARCPTLVADGLRRAAAL